MVVDTRWSVTQSAEVASFAVEAGALEGVVATLGAANLFEGEANLSELSLVECDGLLASDVFHGCFWLVWLRGPPPLYS